MEQRNLELGFTVYDNRRRPDFIGNFGKLFRLGKGHI